MLVTLGGSDPDNGTAVVLRSLVDTGHPFTVKVVIGGSNPHADAIEAMARESELSMECVRNAEDMPGLMQEADLIVTADGSTVWEACCLGLPGMVGVIAENQASNAERMDAAGLLRNIGRFSESDPATVTTQFVTLADDPVVRREMSGRGRRLVDGDGVARAWFAMNAGTVRLGSAREEDSELVWNLVNEESVRAMSFESSQIPWESHLEWYGARLADERCCFWLARDSAGEFVGQVRFDCEGESAVISLSLTPEFRGRGYSGLLIWVACRQFSERFPRLPVLAWIRPENKSSIRAFEAAGFEKVLEEHLKGQPALGYRWQPV